MEWEDWKIMSGWNRRFSLAVAQSAWVPGRSISTASRIYSNIVRTIFLNQRSIANAFDMSGLIVSRAKQSQNSKMPTSFLRILGPTRRQDFGSFHSMCISRMIKSLLALPH